MGFCNDMLRESEPRLRAIIGALLAVDDPEALHYLWYHAYYDS